MTEGEPSEINLVEKENINEEKTLDEVKSAEKIQIIEMRWTHLVRN